MNIHQKIKVALSLFIIGSGSAMAGISIDSSRIIFQASDDARGKSVGVTSAVSSPVPYLVKTQVAPDIRGQDMQTPFVTTPSLFRLEPGSTNQVLIVKKPGVSGLPQNQESVFYFRSVAMPSGKEQAATSLPVVGGELQVATATVIKLFYRPSGLPISQQKAMSQLQFSSTGQGLKVTNPTPYYITLSSLQVAGVPVSLSTTAGNAMIAPFGNQVYSRTSHQGKVEWKAINDYGGTEVFHGAVR